MKNLTAKQKITSNSHSLRLRNMLIDELNKGKRENKGEEYINYYQREIDEINKHLDSLPTSASVWDLTETRRNDFIAGAKWQQERMYSEKEVKKIIETTLIEYSDFVLADIPKWFEQFKKK